MPLQNFKAMNLQANLHAEENRTQCTKKTHKKTAHAVQSSKPLNLQALQKCTHCKNDPISACRSKLETHEQLTSKLMTSWLLETSSPVWDVMATPARSSQPSGISVNVVVMHFLQMPMFRASTCNIQHSAFSNQQSRTAGNPI